MMKKIAIGFLSIPVVLAAVVAGAESLSWDWPSDLPGDLNQCIERSCENGDDPLFQNHGKPCTQAVPGEKCVVAFEYAVHGRTNLVCYARGEVPADHCGRYEKDLGPAVGDVYDWRGDLIEENRGKYRSMIRSVACDGSASGWEVFISGDEPYCMGVEAGDVNGDGAMDTEDFTHLLDYLFNAGDAPSCFNAADIQDNGFLGLFDLIVLFLSL